MHCEEATAAADTNVPERLFKSHGRWKIDYSSGSIQEQIKVSNSDL